MQAILPLPATTPVSSTSPSSSSLNLNLGLSLSPNLANKVQRLHTDIDASLARLTEQFQQFVVEEQSQSQSHHKNQNKNDVLSPFTPLHSPSTTSGYVQVQAHRRRPAISPFVSTGSNTYNFYNFNSADVDVDADSLTSYERQRRSAEHQRREEQKARSEAKWREVMRPGGPRRHVLKDLERGGYPRHKQILRLVYA